MRLVVDRDGMRFETIETVKPMSEKQYHRAVEVRGLQRKKGELIVKSFAMHRVEIDLIQRKIDELQDYRFCCNYK